VRETIVKQTVVYRIKSGSALVARRGSVPFPGFSIRYRTNAVLEKNM